MTPAPPHHRVAIYAAPSPGSDWWERGSAWLGRCAQGGAAPPMPVIDGVDPATQAALTADPRRYGWHATLKAPMRLAPGAGWATLRDGVAAICRDHHAIEMADLEVTRMGTFLALRPAAPPAALGALANDCVQRLQALAAPLDDAELARRRRVPLSAEEDALLLAWGYPWVLHRFRFHCSLTGSLAGLDGAAVQRWQSAAHDHFKDLPPWRLDRLSLFVEPTPGADFVLLEQWELRA